MAGGFWWAKHIAGTWKPVQSGEPPARFGAFHGPYATRNAAQRECNKLNGVTPANPRPNNGATPTISGSALAGDFMKYQGTPYVFGGSNPTDGWDCSSAVNWVLGHDFNMKLPGSLKPGFAGTSHGPDVLQYASWTKASVVMKPEVGDLCIWPGAGADGHIGMATSPTHMISALNPALGTATSPIHGSGPPGVPVMFKRINAAGNSVAAGCIPGATLIARMMRIWTLS